MAVVVLHNNNKTFLIILPLCGIVRFRGLCLGIALFSWIPVKYERTCVCMWAEKISEIGSLNIVTRTDCTSVTVLTDGFSIGLSLFFFFLLLLSCIQLPYDWYCFNKQWQNYVA